MLASLLLLPLALAQHNYPMPWKRHAHREAARNGILLDERGMPITATTTMVVEMTTTQTVWVMETGQAPVGVPSLTNQEGLATGGSASASGSGVAGSPTASGYTSGYGSASASGSGVAGSASDSGVAGSPSGSGVAGSASASASYSGVDGSATLTAAPSATDSGVAGGPSGSGSAGASSGSNRFIGYGASSASGSPQPSPTPSASASSTFDYNPSSIYVGSSSASASASASLSASASASESASLNATSSSTSLSVESVSSSTTLQANTTSVTPTASVTSSSTSSSASATLAPLGNTLMNGYYPDWSGSYLSPQNVDFSKFDVIDFAFALPTASGGLEFTQWDSSTLLTQLVAQGHAAGKRVKLSIGGWTGSAYFSTLCSDPGLRATFVSNILAAYQSYNLDGIDIDWEYPGVQGAGGNAVSGSDSANFLLFLQDLRAALPNGALISLATQVWPFADQNGNPMTDVSGFAAVIDWILIMNYDIWGSSSTPGPNAPLSNACGNSTQPLANAYAAVASWTSAGMPANKITLGVPAYGYLQMSSANSLVQKREVLPHRPQKRYVTVQNDNGGTQDGQVMFEALISQGALAMDSNGNYVGAGGFTREWDGCSSTPWLKSWSSGQIVTYDDPQSMSLKGQFAAQAGIRGCNVFSIDGDWTGYSWPLTDAVRSGLGI